MTIPDLSAMNAAGLALRLTDLHRLTQRHERVQVLLPGPTAASRSHLNDILEGAGFSLARHQGTSPSWLTRQWTLPDTVAPSMALLISGLNPSPAAADAGIGFARPGNRFWPAALAAGVATLDRDPDHALAHHGLAMTDIVKRTTRRADELAPQEYEHGIERLTRLVGLFQPRAICFVGLAGWRAVRDPRASPGWQPSLLGATPVYVMPSTSGLNASSQLPDFVRHLTAVAHGP